MANEPINIFTAVIDTRKLRSLPKLMFVIVFGCLQRCTDMTQPFLRHTEIDLRSKGRTSSSDFQFLLK